MPWPQASARVPSRGRVYVTLLCIAALWGLGLPMMRVVVHDLGPSQAIFWRFFVGAVCVLPWAWPHLGNRAMQKAGLLLGCFSSLLYSCLSRALLLMPTAQCSFWLGTSVLWVPVFSAVLFRRKMLGRDILAAVLCLLGLGTFCRFDLRALGAGELLALGAAVSFASSILTLHTVTSAPTAKPVALMFYELVTISTLCAPSAVAGGAPGTFTPACVAALLYCSVCGTLLASALQMRYQRHASAPSAAIIYALKPVFTCLFAWLFFSEGISKDTMGGGAIILLASMLPHLPWLGNRQL